MPRSKAAEAARDRREYEIMLAYMVAKYPTTFFPRHKDAKPLKIGIMQDALADNPEVPKRQMQRFVGSYVHKNRYLRGLVDCVFRVDLTGAATEPVRQSAKDFAAATLARRRAEAKQAAKPELEPA